MKMEFDHESLKQVCRACRVRRVILFGSETRGLATPNSDIDLLIDYDPQARTTLWDHWDLEEELNRIFGGRKVDLVALDGLSVHTREDILKTGIPLYES